MSQDYKFVFTPNEANVSELEDLQRLIKKAESLARAPISRMRVGVVGCAASGRIYLGVNVEFPGLPLHHSIHAEQFLVTNLALNSELELTHLAVATNTDGTEYGRPSGHCIQLLLEMRNARDIKILKKSKYDLGPYFCRLGSCLPTRSFAPNAIHDWPLLLEERHNGLFFFPDPHRETCSSGCSHLKCRALAAANKSYAPYTDSPSGVALRDDDGNLYSGWFIESVTSNPSMAPVEAALVDFVARSRGKEFNKIVEAVLVEKNNARVSQEPAAKLLLESIAHPDCDFKVFHCKKN